MIKYHVTLLLIVAINCYLFAQEAAPYVRGELLVQFGKNYLFQSQERESSIFEIKERLSKSMNIYRVTFDADKNQEGDVMRAINISGNVLHIQRNHYCQQRSVPNDSLFARQWQWVNSGSNGGVEDADVDADEAWDITTGGLTASGDTIVVAVVDDGASLNHPDLKDAWWKNYHEIPDNGIDDDENGYIDDFDGWNAKDSTDNVSGGSHGVNVAGMIGATGNNKIGVTGINWKVKIMPVKYISNLTEANVIVSYEYVLQQRLLYNQTNGTKGAFVVACNSSWGIDKGKPSESPLWCGFYDIMGEAGILSVGATSNNNINVDVDGDLPTACSSDFLISVTSTNNKDIKAVAGYGKTTIDVGAPGNGIFTTSSSAYTSTSGTSFATPLVSGIVALAYSAPCDYLAKISKKVPSEAARYVKDAILNGVDKLDTLKNLTLTGGRVNAFKTLLQILDNCSSCQRPSALDVTNISDIQATLNAKVIDSTNQQFLLWRMKGQTAWTEEKNISFPFVFNGLQGCTEYEYRLYSKCQDSVSRLSSIQTFKTDGCCELPKEFSVLKTTESTALLAWTKVLASKEYTIRFKEIGNSAWTVRTLTGSTNTFLSGLKNCSKYTAEIGINCLNDTIEYGNTISFSTIGCGACVDSTYCVAKATSSNSEWIKNVKIGAFENPTASNGGYTLFSGTGIKVKQGEHIPITLEPGFSGSNYEEYFKVWIDYNQDGILNDSLEIAFDPKKGTKVAINDTIRIPKDAAIGLTRLRVAMRYNSNISSYTSCTMFSFGEVEDYCITIEDATANEEIQQNSTLFQVIPNPFSDVIIIRNIENMTDCKAELHTLDGKLLKTEQLLPHESKVFTSDLPDGIYVLKIISKKINQTEKLIKIGN